MKRAYFAILILISTLNLTAQINFKTGDVEMETDLNKINARAKVDFGKFKVEMAGTYNIGEKKIDHMYAKMSMEPAEIYMALEIGKLSHREIDEVLDVYKIHKNKGWGFIAKQMGIKPGSDEFHQLKNSTNSYNPENQEKGKNKYKNKGKGKDKSKK